MKSSYFCSVIVTLILLTFLAQPATPGGKGVPYQIKANQNKSNADHGLAGILGFADSYWGKTHSRDYHSCYANEPADNECKCDRDFILELAVALFTMILAGAAIYQAMLSREQAMLSREQNRRSHESTRMELRAYLALEPVNLREDVLKSGTGTPSVTIKNYGQTPAYAVRVGILWDNKKPSEMEYLPINNWSKCAPINPTRDANQKGVNVSPEKAIARLDEAWNFSEEDFFRGDTSIYVYGEVRYNDVFGREHRSYIRAEYNANKKFIKMPDESSEIYPPMLQVLEAEDT